MILFVQFVNFTRKKVNYNGMSNYSYRSAARTQCDRGRRRTDDVTRLSDGGTDGRSVLPRRGHRVMACRKRWQRWDSVRMAAGDFRRGYSKAAGTTTERWRLAGFTSSSSGTRPPWTRARTCPLRTRTWSEAGGSTWSAAENCVCYGLCRRRRPSGRQSPEKSSTTCFRGRRHRRRRRRFGPSFFRLRWRPRFRTTRRPSNWKSRRPSRRYRRGWTSRRRRYCSRRNRSRRSRLRTSRGCKTRTKSLGAIRAVLRSKSSRQKCRRRCNFFYKNPFWIRRRKDSRKKRDRNTLDHTRDFNEKSIDISARKQ